MMSRMTTPRLDHEAAIPAAPLFEPDQVRKAYEAESLALCQRAVRAIALLGTVLILLFVPFDCARHPDIFPLALRLRLAMVSLLGTVFVLLRHSTGRRYARPLGVLCPAAGAAMMHEMMLLTGGHTSHYFAALGMILLTVPLIIPWRPLWSFALCIIVIGYYTLETLLIEPAINTTSFLDNLFVLTATSAIAVITTARAEHLRWREFHTRFTVAEAYRHKSEFFASMSHELRTPIHVIIGYVDMMLDRAAAAAESEAQEMLTRVRKEGMLLYRLVSDLLDYAKVEAGKMEVHLETVPVGQVLHEVGAGFRPLAEQKGIQLRTELRDDLASVVTDRQKLEQILHNLVGNAIKFTESGVVTIEACAAAALPASHRTDLMFLDRSEVAAMNKGPNGTGVAIAVSDTGVGIRQSDLARLAVDFQQVNGAAANHRGTGLGLSLSRKLVSLLGGRIAVRSAYGQGSTFLVFLPEQHQPA
jgi:signal transduction histidine kinase